MSRRAKEGPTAREMLAVTTKLREEKVQDSRTHDETLADYVRSMGADMGQLYLEVEDEVSCLHEKWGELQELYGKGSERIDLLNKVASSFFYLV